MPENFETRLEAKQELKGVSEVITKEADYNVIYNVHIASIPAETLRAIKPHALFLESPANAFNYVNYIKSKSLNPEDKTNESIFSTIANFTDEKIAICYSKIMREACDEQIPVFIVDSADIKSFFTKNAYISRRQFLKQALKTASELVGGAYLASASAYFYVPKFQSKMSPDNLPPKISLSINKAMDNTRKIHPEIKDSLILQGRNELMAEKSEIVAKMLGKELNIKPKIALAVGGRHYEIEEFLKESEETRMEKLYKFLGDDLKKENLAVRIDFLPPTETGDLVFKASLIELPVFETFVNKKSHSASSAG